MTREGDERRQKAREHYREHLEKEFVVVDKDNSGFASVEETW